MHNVSDPPGHPTLLFQYRKRYDPNRDVKACRNRLEKILFQYRKRYDPNRDFSDEEIMVMALVFQYRKRYDPNRDRPNHNEADKMIVFQYRKRYDPNRDGRVFRFPSKGVGFNTASGMTLIAISLGSISSVKF